MRFGGNRLSPGEMHLRGSPRLGGWVAANVPFQLHIEFEQSELRANYRPLDKSQMVLPIMTSRVNRFRVGVRKDYVLRVLCFYNARNTVQ